MFIINIFTDMHAHGCNIDREFNSELKIESSLTSQDHLTSPESTCKERRSSDTQDEKHKCHCCHHSHISVILNTPTKMDHGLFISSVQSEYRSPHAYEISLSLYKPPKA